MNRHDVGAGRIVALACLLGLGASRDEADAAFARIAGIALPETPEQVLADLREALAIVREEA